MAISYTSNIYTQDRLFFIKLLFRWTGSVWQLLWVDYLIFVGLYVLLALVYQNIAYDFPQWRQTFVTVVNWIGLIRTSVPLSFMLGFFVTSVLGRWWSTCMCIPWLHGPSFYCQAMLDTTRTAHSDISRKLRITVLRYLNLSWILMMAQISAHVKERFGYWKLERKKFKLTWQQRLEMINKDSKVQKYFGSLITENELQAFARSAELSNDTDTSYSPEYWLPLVWASRLMRRARNIGCLADERQFLWMVEIVNRFRSDLGTLSLFAEFNIPLVYTQVAVAAVYIFLLSTLVSTQLTDASLVAPIPSGVNATAQAPNAVQMLAYVPIIGSLEFVFYLGWFKIGVCLLNCMGQDKADLPLSDILNFNMKASVKLGGAEDRIFPEGLADNGEVEEKQVAEFLRSFDFDGVHAHDKFGSAEQTTRQLNKQLRRRLQAPKELLGFRTSARRTLDKLTSGSATPRRMMSQLSTDSALSATPTTALRCSNDSGSEPSVADSVSIAGSVDSLGSVADSNASVIEGEAVVDAAVTIRVTESGED